jgi:predicted lipase
MKDISFARSVFTRTCVRNVTHVGSISSIVDVIAVSQKKDIKRQKEKLDVMKKEAEEEKVRAKEAARDRVLLEFEKGQLVLSTQPTVGSTVATSGSDSSESEPFPKLLFSGR